MSEQANVVSLEGLYGSDLTHALSAWSSTSRELTKEKESRVNTLLLMLAQDGHHTPFEKSYLHFLATTDLATHIHLLKHRIGVSVNSESARYKELKEDKFYVPEDWPETQREALRIHAEGGMELYHSAVNDLIASGFTRKRAKESGRFFRPVAMQYTVDIAFNFRSFMHFQGLRNDSHAQLEVRLLAEEMLRLVRETNRFNASLKAFGLDQGPLPIRCTRGGCKTEAVIELDEAGFWEPPRGWLRKRWGSAGVHMVCSRECAKLAA